MTVSSVDSAALLNKYIDSQKTASTAATKSGSSSGLWGNFDTYLKILTAQLQNQDPTQPMEASEFTNQLVQYASVEQQISTNDKLDQVLSTINSNGITPLLSYVGQYVETPADGKIVVQGGSGKMAYTLPSDAQSVKIYIKDGKGKVVATMDGPKTSGTNRVVWDGTLDAGGKAGDGVYTMQLVAKDNTGKTIEVNDIRTIGQVTGIETGTDGATVLKVGSLSVKDTNVLSVFGGVTTADTSGGSSDTNTGTDTGTDTETTPETTPETESS